MRICTISHSHIALRQQLFFREVAKQGHDVLMISPGQWRDLRTENQRTHYDSGGDFGLVTCRHMGGENIYTYHLLGAQALVEDFKPDWLYVQAEPGSVTSDQALQWKVDKRALFTWENIHLMGSNSLRSYDLIVCGNADAEALVKPHNRNTALMLQVGVDTDHFQARPDVLRNVKVAYIGRRTPEKGLPYLIKAWPTAYLLDWKDYKELPWWYSQVEVVVAYSQDIPQWREQAPNYVVLEALSCGCKAVVSTTAAMVGWLAGCPGVTFVEGHEQPDEHLDPVKVDALREGINLALGEQFSAQPEARDMVIERFSNVAVARKLLEVMGA